MHEQCGRAALTHILKARKLDIDFAVAKLTTARRMNVVLAKLKWMADRGTETSISACIGGAHI